MSSTGELFLKVAGPGAEALSECVQQEIGNRATVRVPDSAVAIHILNLQPYIENMKFYKP